MTLQRQIGFWIAALIALVLTLYVLRDALLPFIAGLALAYLLDPLASRFERMGMSRLIASLMILGLVLLIFVLALVLLAPLIGNQLSAFIARLPGIIERLQQLMAEQGGSLLENFGGQGAVAEARKSVGDIADRRRAGQARCLNRCGAVDKRLLR